MKLRPKPDLFNAACPSRALLHRVANKWTMLVIDTLGKKRMRNAELMRRIQGISQKMLTQTLRELEDMRLVDRFDMRTLPPHVEYSLSQRGISLQKEVCSLNRWIEDHMYEIA
jgi:DNA-binding HxlR family transcriptional regulator